MKTKVDIYFLVVYVQILMWTIKKLTDEFVIVYTFCRVCRDFPGIYYVLFISPGLVNIWPIFVHSLTIRHYSFGFDTNSEFPLRLIPLICQYQTEKELVSKWVGLRSSNQNGLSWAILLSDICQIKGLPYEVLTRYR